MTDIREYDVNFHARVVIDLDIRMALWYKVYFRSGLIDKLELISEMVDRPDMRILAFDIGYYIILINHKIYIIFMA